MTISTWYRLADPESRIDETTWQKAVVHDRLKSTDSPEHAPQASISGVVRDGLHTLKTIPLKRAHLIDVGCGTGLWSRVLPTATEPMCSWQYTGLEIDHARIETCRRLHQGVDFVMGRAEQLPLANSSFDIALCSGVLQYLRDWTNGLPELSRVARSYIAILRMPVLKYWATALCHQTAHSAAGKEEHHFWLLNRDDFERQAAQAGLRLLTRDYTEECTRVEGLDERVFWLNYVFDRTC